MLSRVGYGVKLTFRALTLRRSRRRLVLNAYIFKVTFLSLSVQNSIMIINNIARRRRIKMDGH